MRWPKWNIPKGMGAGHIFPEADGVGDGHVEGDSGLNLKPVGFIIPVKDD